MKTFLYDLANAYCNHHLHDMYRYRFVFPNKRAGTFFIRHIDNYIKINRISIPIIQPDVLTISELVEQISGLVPDNRIDMLFLLYDEYCKLQPADVPKPEFDRFRAWGDTILSDFNDVDMYMADAKALFSNLSNYKEIQTDYLTPDQKRVLNQYFGDKFFATDSTRSFWKHFNNAITKGATKPKFLRIWQVLYSLYQAFRERLTAEGLSYPGYAFLTALQKLRDAQDIPQMLNCKRIIFVGFNALSTVEHTIFSLLRDTKLPDGTPLADFYWDATGPAMQDPNNSAVKFINANRKAFPSLYKLTDSSSNSFPQTLEVIGCPSNSIQAKEITGILNQLTQQDNSNYAIANARAAVVLPDERLLTPLLYALPDNIGPCNVTMGYPIKTTSVASFMSLVRRMQLRRRTSKAEINYFYEDVMALIQHPIAILLLDPAKIAAFITRAIQEKMFLVPATLLCSIWANHTILFSPADRLDSEAIQRTGLNNSVTAYIYTLMSDICRAITDTPVNQHSALIQNRLDHDNAQIYMQYVCQLDATLHRRGISTSTAQIFRLTDRLLASEQVTIQGKPLRGLQIMGMLETRGIDFEYVIIPSMNEKVFPRKAHKRSFIPNALRIGYGLATSYFEESIFAYNFYRLISRAKHVYMLYDTRADGLRSGDVSRYILQLQHLYKPKSLTFRQINFQTVQSVPNRLIIPKTGRVRQILDQYLTEPLPGEKPKALSASALKTYLKCPLMFYLQKMCRLDNEDKLDEFINPIDQGDIFHKIMDDIYHRLTHGQKKNDQGHILIPAQTINAWLTADRDKVNSIIAHHMGQYLKTTSAAKNPDNIGQDIILFNAMLHRYVFEALTADKKIADRYGHIIFISSENQEYVKYTLPDGRDINMTYIIDRLDRLGIDRHLLRISDYKTGADEPAAKNLAELFTNKNLTGVFQLMIYAILLSKQYGYQGPIRLDMYCTRDLHVRKHDTQTYISGQPISDHRVYQEQFTQILNDKLTELFDYDIPFVPTDHKDTCKNCTFLHLCNQTH